LTAPSLLRIESKWFCTVRGLIARWDLRVLEDPQLDARAATPLWLAREPVSTRSTSHAWDLREIDELAVWTRAGGRLFHDGERVLLMDPRCRRAAICASPRALAHLRMLQARDGVLAGASQREIAIGLFGDDRVTSQWLPDSALRAQVRRYLQRARAYSSGEYRALVRYIVPTTRVSKSSLISTSRPDQTHCQCRGPAEPLRGAIEPATMPSEPIKHVAPRYLTADEAAEFLRLSPRTLEKHATSVADRAITSSAVRCATRCQILSVGRSSRLRDDVGPRLPRLARDVIADPAWHPMQRPISMAVNFSCFVPLPATWPCRMHRT